MGQLVLAQVSAFGPQQLWTTPPYRLVGIVYATLDVVKVTSIIWRTQIYIGWWGQSKSSQFSKKSGGIFAPFFAARGLSPVSSLFTRSCVIIPRVTFHSETLSMIFQRTGMDTCSSRYDMVAQCCISWSHLCLRSSQAQGVSPNLRNGTLVFTTSLGAKVDGNTRVECWYIRIMPALFRFPSVFAVLS